MQEQQGQIDPFNWTYFIVAIVTLLAIPLMHVFLGWFVYYL